MQSSLDLDRDVDGCDGVDGCGGSHPAVDLPPLDAEVLNQVRDLKHYPLRSQPLQERPTQATLDLLPLMPRVDCDSACILPSALHMVKACSHYAFQVRAPCGADTPPLMIPCQKIISLVKSTKGFHYTTLGHWFQSCHTRH